MEIDNIADTSVITCAEIIFVMGIVSTKMANTIVTKNFHSKKSKWFLYFAYGFINSHITLDNYYYLLSLCKA